jgi:hypothetical protein
VCRASYIHPSIIEGYLGGTFALDPVVHDEPDVEPAHGLRLEEQAVLDYLRQKAREPCRVVAVDSRTAADGARLGLRTAARRGVLNKAGE